MKSIFLNWSEARECAHIAVGRRIDNDILGSTPAHGFDGALWDIEVYSCLAERVVAKYMGLYWNPTAAKNFRLIKADVGTSVEVRQTLDDNNRLIWRPQSDHENRLYVLVVGPKRVTGVDGGYTLNIVGGIMGRDAKSEKWKMAPNGRPPAYFVPQNALDINLLK